MDELQRRRNTLLDDYKLNMEIARMIRKLDLPATCHSITSITGRDGRDEIVIELFVDIKNTANIARVFLYITANIFEDDGFKACDTLIRNKNSRFDHVNIDDRILLRALKTVHSVIYNLYTGWANAVKTDKIIYVRTNFDGTCEYNN